MVLIFRFKYSMLNQQGSFSYRFIGNNMGNSLNSLVFRPPKPTYSKNDPHLHMIPKPEGDAIAAYFVRHRSAEWTFLFNHGNAEDLGMVARQLVRRIPYWKVNFFAYDYSGYGRSGGTFSEKQVYRDAELVYNYLTNILGVRKEKIIAYGRSLGSGPAVHLCVKNKLGGLILQCPIASIHRVKLNVPFTLPGDIFCNIDKVSQVKCPTLIVHGTKDEIVSIGGSLSMLKKFKLAYYYWIQGGSHNDLDTHFLDEFNYAIIGFLSLLNTPLEQQNDNVLPLDIRLAVQLLESSKTWGKLSLMDSNIVNKELDSTSKYEKDGSILTKSTTMDSDLPSEDYNVYDTKKNLHPSIFHHHTSPIM